MSAGSGASNLGYGGTASFSGINGKFVNVDSSNWPGSFGSNEVSGTPPGIFSSGLAGAKSNVDAAAGVVPGVCLFKGGSKRLKRKIKNITKQYRTMKHGSRKMKSLKQRLKHRVKSRKMSRGFAGGKKSRRHQCKTRGQLGGYSQYQNNLPLTSSYQVAGINLPSSQLALANPAPYTKLGGQCIDNYNHFTNKGFPSRGH